MKQRYRILPLRAGYCELQILTTLTGRLPQRHSEDPAERRLYQSISWQRTRHAEGRLTPDEAAPLNQLGNLQGSVRRNRETHRRSTHFQLLSFVAETERVPHRENAQHPNEATLSVWIQIQRAEACAGKLTPARRGSLDRTVPG